GGEARGGGGVGSRGGRGARPLRREWRAHPGLDEGRPRDALRGLERITRWSGSARLLWPPLARLARALDRPARVLDVAAGAGDVLRRLARRSRRAGLGLVLEGCDVRPVALAHAPRPAPPHNA